MPSRVAGPTGCSGGAGELQGSLAPRQCGRAVVRAALPQPRLPGAGLIAGPMEEVSPLGPFIRLTSMMVSGGGCLRRTTSRTTGPASFSASTALLCTTSETSTSFTLRTQSFTLQQWAGCW